MHSPSALPSAKRTASGASASPQREQSKARASRRLACTRSVQAEQTGERPASVMGPPQTGQSDGNAALTKSERAACVSSEQLRSTRVTALHPRASPPGGPPVPSRTSFAITLKTDLTRGTAQRNTSCADGRSISANVTFSPTELYPKGFLQEKSARVSARAKFENPRRGSKLSDGAISYKQCPQQPPRRQHLHCMHAPAAQTC